MQDRRIAKELRLEEDDGRRAPHLELHDTDGKVEQRWQLRDTSNASDWQPVEYARPTQTSANWVLPSLVGIVLLAVVGYMVYIGLNRLSSINIPAIGPEEGQIQEGSADTGADPAAPVVAAVEQVATATAEPIEEPTATALPTEPPTAEPTAVLIEQQIAVITNQFGVNARLSPSTDAEVLRILEEGESVIILDEQEDTAIEGNWLQVRTSEDAIVWISSQFVDISTQVVQAEPSSAAATLPTLDISVTISSPAGLNARAEPDSASEIVALLPDNSSYPAVSQSDDGQWIEVQLENGDTAWIFLQLVITNQDLADLPIFREGATDGAESTAIDATETPTDTVAIEASPSVTETVEVAASPSISETEPVTDTVIVTDTVVVTESAGLTETVGVTETAIISDSTAVAESGTLTETTPLIDTGATISVTSQFGVNARTTTSTEADVVTVLEAESETALRGRNADSSWVQVVLDDGTLAWVFAQAVTTSVDIETLPIFTPPAVGEPAEILIVPDVTSTSAEPASPATSEEPVEETAGTEETPAVDPTGEIAKVSVLLGAKARPGPTTEETEIETVRFNTELPILGRTENSEWLQVQLADGQAAWVLVSNVNFSIDIGDIPVTE